MNELLPDSDVLSLVIATVVPSKPVLSRASFHVFLKRIQYSNDVKDYCVQNATSRFC